MDDPKFDFEPSNATLHEPYADMDLIEGIPKHFEELLGPVTMVYHENESSFVHLDLIQFGPDEIDGGWTFVTCGMASLPMNVPGQVQNAEAYRYAELVLHLPASWPMEWDRLKRPENFWPLQVMKSFARLPHAKETWVWYGHTLRNGDPPEPYPNTRFDAVLACPAMQLPREVRAAEIPKGREVTFLTLAFIYPGEWERVHEVGGQQFFELVKQSGIRPMEFFQLNLTRPSVLSSP